MDRVSDRKASGGRRPRRFLKRRVLKIAFAGTPPFALTVLDALLGDEQFEVVQVFAQPARQRGRGMMVTPSPVELRARERGLPISTPASWNADADETLTSSGADVLVTAAYGILLSSTAIALPRLGAVNVHASLLPRWRGAAPIQRALEAGDRETGVSIFTIVPGPVDSGPVLARAALTIAPRETSVTLADRLAVFSAEILVRVLSDLDAGRLTPEPQDAAKVTRAAKLRKEEGALDWPLAAEIIDRKVRAYTPWPGVKIGEIRLLDVVPVPIAPVPVVPVPVVPVPVVPVPVVPVPIAPVPVVPGTASLMRGASAPGRILSIDPLIVAVGAAGADALRLDRVQRDGGRPVAGCDYARGARLAVGDHLVSGLPTRGTGQVIRT